MTPEEKAKVPIPAPQVVLPELHAGLRLAGGQKNLTLLQRNEAKDFALGVLRDPAYRQSVRDRAKAGTLPPAIETMLWHYAYGKPIERVELSKGPDLSDLSEADLAARASLLHTVLSAVAEQKAMQAALEGETVPVDPSTEKPTQDQSIAS